MNQAIRFCLAFAMASQLTGCVMLSDWQIDPKVEKMEQYLAQGKSVVVMPLFHAFEPGNPQQDGHFLETMDWQDVDDPQKSFVSGRSDDPTRPIAYILDDPVGQMRFYLIEPGRYSAQPSREELHNANAGVALKQSPPAGKLGTVIMEETVFEDSVVTGQYWENPSYTTEQVPQSYCTLMHASGACLNWSTSYSEASRQISAGGWRDRYENVERPGLRLQVKTARPAATFEAKPGEILLVDGLFAQENYYEVDPRHCWRQADKQIACDLGYLQLVRKPINFADFTTRIGDGVRSQTYRDFLKRVTYRPLEMHIPRVRRAAEGEVYRLGQ